MTEHPCPQWELLREFAVGKMGGPEWESVARHVETCPDCQGHLDRLDPVNDELVSQLQRQSAGPGNQPRGQNGDDSPWVRAAQELSSRFGSLGRKVAADAGRDLAERLLAGPVLLDRFELRSELGVGSFGYVFQAWDSTWSGWWPSKCSGPEILPRMRTWSVSCAGPAAPPSSSIRPSFRCTRLGRPTTASGFWSANTSTARHWRNG